jgi:hypothetical protein
VSAIIDLVSVFSLILFPNKLAGGGEVPVLVDKTKRRQKI